MGGRGTVNNFRYPALYGSYDSGEYASVTKNVRGKTTVYDKENNILEPSLLRVDEGPFARLTRKEAKLVSEVQKALQKGNNHFIINNLPKDLQINKIHVEDKAEWYKRSKKKEMKGAKDPYNMNKDTPFLLKNNKDGMTLVVTYSATQQGSKKLSSRYKNNKGVARNISEAVLREQAKLVYNNMKRNNKEQYNRVHRGLIKYDKTSPTSKSSSNAIRRRGSTMEAFADAYVLNATKRKSSVGKNQKALVRGTMHWLGDSNLNRSTRGTTKKLTRIQDQAKSQYLMTNNQRYHYFITKYTKKR